MEDEKKGKEGRREDETERQEDDEKKGRTMRRRVGMKMRGKKGG